MLKKTILSMACATLWSIQGFASTLTLSDVIDAAPDLAQFSSQTMPLQYGEPLQVKLGGQTHPIRFFFYHNKENPHMSFGEVLNSRLKETFVENPEVKNSFYIAATDDEKAQGISYVLSLDTGGIISAEKKNLPTAAKVLKKSETLRTYKSSELTYPANPKSIVTIRGERYQIRYFKFFKQGAGQFGTYVRETKLEGMQSVIKNYGYGDLVTFIADESWKEPGLQLILSLGKLEK
jgi:hypothetical protein